MKVKYTDKKMVIDSGEEYQLTSYLDHLTSYLDHHICNHCGYPVSITNPSGYCNHINYPDHCFTCKSKDKPSVLIRVTDFLMPDEVEL